ncbi:hypothetical protein [Agrobacterium vitis]|uniref:hypothetical protein n=1 Tax=Agrobacterium vitis TaxID=373 RepID=UPI001572A159|nr:hypothetical protein [Agrobacterium vitis]NSZ17622.1 hypothetical protein [Agrobacterium vitis]QZO03312.1 hypothetical protein K4831_12815 [Agrobacterium vitis]UJL88432.1 hypothetical protein AVF2S5_11155 [Agrobacterium vitis]
MAGKPEGGYPCTKANHPNPKTLMNRFIILSGCFDSGKSTLLAALGFASKMRNANEGGI